MEEDEGSPLVARHRKKSLHRSNEAHSSATESFRFSLSTRFREAIHSALAVENRKLVVYLLVLIVFATLDIVLFALTTQSLDNYPDFAHQLIIFSYVPVFFVIVRFKLATDEDISASMLSYPKRKFLLMGFMDACATALAVFGSLTPGAIQTLLRQVTAPSSPLVASYTFTDAHKQTHTQTHTHTNRHTHIGSLSSSCMPL